MINMSENSKYDDPYKCEHCSNKNDVKVRDRIDYTVTEYETTCSVCGHQGYWEYGHYMR